MIKNLKKPKSEMNGENNRNAFDKRNDFSVIGAFGRILKRWKK